MAWKEEITSKEKELVDEFKSRVLNDIPPPLLQDESLFYRFMKARDFDIDEAELMIKKHVAWRKEMKVDTILNDYTVPEVLDLYNTISFLGFDKDGCPVRYIDIGNSDPKGAFQSLRVTDLTKYYIYVIEQDMLLLQNQSEKLGKPITNITFIYNYENMTFAKATHKKGLESIMQAITIYQDNYPERIKSIYIVNASIYFTMLFAAIKHVVSAGILQKVRFFGKEGWKEALREIMDVEDLPVFLGGNKTDENGDPLCSSYINHGKVIPEKYFLKKSEKKLYQAPGVKKLTIIPFSKSDIKFKVDEANSVLEWEFETKSNDIGFGVYFKNKSSKEVVIEELVSNQRIDTTYETEVGMYKCEKVGTYTIVFDNSYSWIRPKEIYYRARIIKPSEQKDSY